MITVEVNCHRSPNNVTTLYLNKKSSVHSSISLQTESVLPSFPNLAQCFSGKRFNINSVMDKKWERMQIM